MRYYIGNLSFDSDYIEHYGVKGMRWGKRKARPKALNEKRNIISDWWTGRDHTRNATGLLKNNSNLRKNAEYFTNKYSNDLDKMYERRAPGRAYERRAIQFDNEIDPIYRQMDTNKRAVKGEIEKYRKAPRQVIAKAIRRGKAKISYTLGKVKRGEIFSKTSKRIKEKGKSLITKYLWWRR